MYAQVHCPTSLLSDDLDHYLERGWFRMGQTVFVTHFLHFKDSFYSAIWLRIDLRELNEGNVAHKKFKQNVRFRKVIQKAFLNEEKEALFAKYRASVSFEASDSLHHLLYNDSILEIYNTHEVALYDGDKLIAIGFFDTGARSAAGIACIYDPDYKKHSLGKYLMYLKMEYCLQIQLDYFYPGYFVPGYKAFDYKLDLHTPYLYFLQLSTQKWLPIQEYTPLQNPLDIMRQKLTELQLLLTVAGIESKMMHYEFFQANLSPKLSALQLFDFPVFLYCHENVEDIVNPIVVYEVRDKKFHLLRCISVWKTEETDDDGVYASQLLKVTGDLFSTYSVNDMRSVLL